MGVLFIIEKISFFLIIVYLGYTHIVFIQVFDTGFFSFLIMFNIIIFFVIFFSKRYIIYNIIMLTLQSLCILNLKESHLEQIKNTNIEYLMTSIMYEFWKDVSSYSVPIKYNIHLDLLQY